MSRVRALAYDLVTEAPPEEELRRRRRAEGPRNGLIGGLTGKLFEPAPVPTQAPRPTGWQADEHTID